MLRPETMETVGRIRDLRSERSFLAFSSFGPLELGSINRGIARTPVKPIWQQRLDMLPKKADEGIVTPETIPFIKLPQNHPDPTFLKGLQKEDRKRIGVQEVAVGVAAAVAFCSSVAAITQTVTEATAVKDTFGPEVTREWLELNPQKITARAYATDETGDVVTQWVVLDNRLLYKASRDSTSKLFSDDFKAILQLPADISSMVISSDGKVMLFGGVSDRVYQYTRMFVSYDEGKSVKEIAVPADFQGAPSDQVRLTDTDYFGAIYTGEGIGRQYIAKIDPNTQTASIRPASIETIVPVSRQVGALQNLKMTSLDVASHTTTMVSTRYLQYGLAVSTINYDTGIGWAQIITQTKLTDGTLINLGYLSGTGVYTDTNGKSRVATSNFIRNILYDFNLASPLDGTATQFNYTNICDNKGIPNYGDGTLSMFALDISFDAQGNRQTRFGGNRSSTLDGYGRAIFGIIEDVVCLDIEPNNRSTGIMRQQDMQRMKFNSQFSYGVNVRPMGEAFIDNDLNVYFTGRGLGSPLVIPPTPTPYRFYLPEVFKGY